MLQRLLDPHLAGGPEVLQMDTRRQERHAVVGHRTEQLFPVTGVLTKQIHNDFISTQCGAKIKPHKRYVLVDSLKKEKLFHSNPIRQTTCLY